MIRTLQRRNVYKNKGFDIFNEVVFRSSPLSSTLPARGASSSTSSPPPPRRTGPPRFHAEWNVAVRGRTTALHHPGVIVSCINSPRRKIHSSSPLLMIDDVYVTMERVGLSSVRTVDGANVKTDDAAADASCSRGASNDAVSDDNYDDEQEEMFVTSDPGLGLGIIREWGGPRRGGALAEPTRFGDWERKGRCTDF
ncbi:hypothetical protein ACHAXA_005667 [Cyclostephanos tholiformis]|uniref:Succinate dehydrogenase assembly factor 4, mitochondrial n=1 Tax=Cyclostephanos tholiformis TaxID=382380 RepID=A0ABD3SR21_9STRA